MRPNHSYIIECNKKRKNNPHSSSYFSHPEPPNVAQTVMKEVHKIIFVESLMAASQVSSTAWLLGDYFEGCNCDIACPCIFFSDPTEGNCHVTCAWHIQNGNYGNTELNNLNVVALFNTPGNMYTGPKWKAALYIDERATQQQKDLITKIYSGQAEVYAAIKLKPVDNFILFLRSA